MLRTGNPPRKVGRILDYDSRAETQVAIENRTLENLVPEISRMTPDDLREYSMLLNDAVTELLRFHRFTNLAYGITRAVTQGAKSDEQLFRMMGARPGEQSTLSQDSSIQH
jgi:hypothetical protein